MIVLHLHVPRSGGTAVSRSLKGGFKGHSFIRYASRPQVEQDPRGKRETFVVSGHFDWGLHEVFNREHLYFIVLRDPIERVGSLYDYVRGKRAHPLHERWSRRTLRQLLVRRDSPMLSNSQVRQISGQRHRIKEVAAEQLETAWQHLLQENVIVTFPDRLNDGLLQLAAQTGVKLQPVLQRHNAAARSTQPSETLDLIRQMNAFDIELYERARREFLDRLAHPVRLPPITPMQAYHERIAAMRAEQEAQQLIVKYRKTLLRREKRLEQLRADQATERSPAVVTLSQRLRGAIQQFVRPSKPENRGTQTIPLAPKKDGR
jgi:hypothetical protein